MNARWSAAAKSTICLAAAAAGDWSVTATAIYILLRVLGTYWGGPELKPHTTTPASVSARLIRWSWRLEVASAVGVATAHTIARRLLGNNAADSWTLLVLVGLAVWPASRRRLQANLLTERRRRRWTYCLATVSPGPAVPILCDFGSASGGEWAQVRIGAGSTVAELANRSEAIAAYLAVDQVRVQRHPTSAGWATIVALAVDPLAQPSPQWPWLGAGYSWVWWPIPVGIDETGQPVTVTLAEHNLLLGGEPGSGKSVALSQLVAAAALDPRCGLWLLDGKLVELAAWRACADGWAGTDIGEAIGLLVRVQQIMEARYHQLLAAGKRKIDQSTPLQVLIVDELAHYLAWPDKKPRDAFADLLRDLVSRGRAAGIVVIAATQKPSSDLIPTSLRDLFGYRWALRCTTNAASDTILGSGWASQGVTAATIAPATRGVGWLLHESSLPVRLRAHYLDDHQIGLLAERAAQLRQAQPEHRGHD